MKRPSPFVAAAAIAAILGTGAPAEAFSLFGFHLWGKKADENDPFEVIDPLTFTVAFEVSGDDADLEGALKSASGLWEGRDRPASGVGGLLARARGDYRRILAALYNNAYYGGEISIRIAGQEAADMPISASLAQNTPVVIQVRPGPRFHFGEARIVNPPPKPEHADDEVKDDIGDRFRRGERADAGVITTASATAVERWRQVSHAKAHEESRDVVADHQTDLLDAVIVLDPDRPAKFGRTLVKGAQRVKPGFIAYMADMPQGRSFDPDQVKAGEDRLNRLGVFSSVRISEADAIAPDGTLDMTVDVQEGKRRTIGVGGTISTIEGLGVEAFWVHRNLFGHAEQLRFDASITGLGLTSQGETFDYSLGLSFTRPGVIRPDVSFVAALTARRLDLDTYREESITARAGFQRSFARWLNGELSAFATKARFWDLYGRRDFLMFGLTAKGDYDRRDDKLNPTRGYYGAAEVVPFYEAEYGNAAARGTLEGRVYKGFGGEDNGRVVLAGRAEIGSYVGPSDRESPPNQLFFAGGADSIRGYAWRSVGIDTEYDDKTGVVGGRSLVEGSGEIRVRFTDSWGGVGFVDGGYVSSSSTFSRADSDLRFGAGVGARYFTGLGPIRVDVAAPLNPRKDDDAVAVYIGIGQAF